MFPPAVLELLPPDVRGKMARLVAEYRRADDAVTKAEAHVHATAAKGDPAASAIAESALQEAKAALDALVFVPRAAAYLEMHGASSRRFRYGVTPAHVIPVMELVRDHAAAVADIRNRLDGLDAAWKQVEDAVAAGTLTPEWRDVHATDLSLARLAWERIEEQIIVSAEDAGVSINRRADLDPAALLEIERA